MASEVGMLIENDSAWGAIITAEPSELKAFAELIRADERRKFANWLEKDRDAPYWAELLRARGQA